MTEKDFKFVDSLLGFAVVGMAVIVATVLGLAGFALKLCLVRWIWGI